MSTHTATTSRSEHKLHGSNLLQGMRRIVMRIAAHVNKRRRARETYMALRGLDDHMLKDIGLSRSDLVDLETFGRGRK